VAKKLFWGEGHGSEIPGPFPPTAVFNEASNYSHSCAADGGCCSCFPYDTSLSREDLARVARAKAWLRARGFAHVRLRVRGREARLELPPEDWPIFLARGLRGLLLGVLNFLGFEALNWPCAAERVNIRKYFGGRPGDPWPSPATAHPLTLQSRQACNISSGQLRISP